MLLIVTFNWYAEFFKSAPFQLNCFSKILWRNNKKGKKTIKKFFTLQKNQLKKKVRNCCIKKESQEKRRRKSQNGPGSVRTPVSAELKLKVKRLRPLDYTGSLEKEGRD